MKLLAIILFIILSPLIFSIILYIKKKLQEGNKPYLTEDFLNIIENLDERINKKMQKLSGEIEVIEMEISIIPNIDEFKDMIEIKKKLLQSLEDKKEIIIQNEITNFINKLPVFIFTGKSSKKDIKVISKNKNLMEMYKLLVKNRFNKDKFLLIIDNGKFEKVIKQLVRLKYEKYFKGKIDVLNLTKEELKIDPDFFEEYFNTLNIQGE